jgi:hypothetical protein
MCNIGQIQRHAEIIGAAKGILALREIPALEVQIDTNPNIEAKIENLIISITDTEPTTRPITPASFTSPIPRLPLESNAKIPKKVRNSAPPITESRKLARANAISVNNIDR